MLDANIIRPRSHHGVFPIVIVDKKKNTLDSNKDNKLDKRFCVDFRQLNKITKPIAYPLPLIDDILALLGKSKYFTSLDLISGYWQIPINEEDREKTAFASGFRGLFQFNVMPFGVKHGSGAISGIS